MKTDPSNETNHRLPSDAGQATIFVVLAMSLFLLGALGFAVDLGNAWFHRQAAQGAADAACQAGAMDMYSGTATSTSSGGKFIAGTAFDCNSATSPSPCWYASTNGYNASLAKGSTSSSPGNEVYVSFPTSVTGVTAASGLTYSFIQVDLVDRVQAFFMPLITGKRTVDVHVQATCGVVATLGVLPMLILDPSDPETFQMSGQTNVAIVGGGSNAARSIQVDSTAATTQQNTSAVNIGGGNPCGGGGGPTIDLCYGGSSFCGSNFGLTANESQNVAENNSAGANYNLYGSTGSSKTCPPPCAPSPAPTCSGTQKAPQWQDNDTAITDPFASLAPPNLPSSAGTITLMVKGNGCPVPTTSPYCDEYTAGSYLQGINVAGGHVAIFDPGIYYVGCGTTACGLVTSGSGIVRPSTATGDGSQGTMFYLTGTGTTPSTTTSPWGTVNISGGGSSVPGFSTSGSGAGAPLCTGGAPLNPSLPTSIGAGAQVLLAPCTGTYGTPGGANRGMLFFQDRRNNTAASNPGQQPTVSAASLLLMGTMYFHECVADWQGNSAGSCNGTGSAAGGYQALLTIEGSGSSGSYTYGSIVTDRLNLTGGGSINMVLSPQLVSVGKAVALVK